MFDPYEKEGRLYGRGSIDDKYAAALSMFLFKEHLNIESALALYRILDEFVTRIPSVGAGS